MSSWVGLRAGQQIGEKAAKSKEKPEKLLEKSEFFKIFYKNVWLLWSSVIL